MALPEDPLLVLGDPVRLTQVFVNLLDNACKYTPRKGEIFVRATRHERTVEVSVSDTGIGLEPERLKQIFEMFSQIEEGPNRKQTGLGIGLSLVRSSVEMHGGTIEARSTGRATAVRSRQMPLPRMLSPASTR